MTHNVRNLDGVACVSVLPTGFALASRCRWAARRGSIVATREKYNKIPLVSLRLCAFGPLWGITRIAAAAVVELVLVEPVHLRKLSWFARGGLIEPDSAGEMLVSPVR